MDPAVFFLVSVVFGSIVLIVWAVRRQRAREQAFREAIPQRGWRLSATPGAGSWVVDGEHDGLPWSVTGVAGGKKQGSRSTTFVAPAPPITGVVLVGPKVPAMLAGLDLGGALVQTLLRQVLGDEAADLAPTHPIDPPAGLAARFSVIGSDAAEAHRLLDDPALQQALAGWTGPEAPVLLRWKDRIEVRVSRLLDAPDQLDRLVAIGTRALAASLG